MLYLDNAATSKDKPKEFYRAMGSYTKKYSVNAGRGGHDFSLAGAAGINETAEELAELFGIENPSRIAFSYNATMSLNQAIYGVLKNGGHAVVTEMEHNSVLRPAYGIAECTMAKADSLGKVSADSIKACIKSNTKLVICTHASNVCGSIEPIEEIGKAVHAHGALFLLDAAQTAGCKKIDVNKMNVDMLAFSAHKGLLGPMGVGGLYVREGIRLEPLLSGGTGSHSRSLSQPVFMPDLLEAGTQNTPGIMALGASVKYIKKISEEAIAAHQKELAFRLIERLLNINGVTVYGICTPAQGERNGTVLFNINDTESGKVCEILNDKFKIAVRGGWHCTYYAHRALGSEKSGAVRASFGIFSKKSDADALADAVYSICKQR